MEDRNCCIEELIGYALSIADDVKSYESSTYKQVVSYSECNSLLQWVRRCRFKAGLIAKGFSQVERVDFVEIF